MASLQSVVVVGASLAGLRALEALRRAGYAGQLTCVGAEPHLPYDRPPLSKEVLVGSWEPERTALRKPETLPELEVDWKLGCAATGLDPTARRLELADGESLEYDALLLATGAAPRTLPAAAGLAGVHTLRSLDDCLALRAELDASPRVAVVGAGFIGAEVAASCRARGLDVTLIEALPTPLGHVLGERLGRTCAALHRDHGVDLRCGVGVADFTGGDRVSGVDLADGTRVAADVVVVGIGVTPNTAWLEGSGLALQDGVVCDATLAASCDGVHAAGDVARWTQPATGQSLRIEHWMNASEQGVVAAENLLAGPAAAKPYESVPFFWSDQYDTKIQMVGHPQPDDEIQVVHGSLEERRCVVLYGRAGRLVAALGFSRARLVMQYRRMLVEGASFEEALVKARS